MKTTTLLTILLSLSSSVFAAEADNFTGRLIDVKDVSAQINEMANGYLEKAVASANEQGQCDEGILYNELRQYFANHSKGELVKTILYTDTVSKTVIPLKESIYGEWNVFDGYLLGNKKAASSPLALSALIKVGDQVVGVDKMEHMFGMGFTYFSEHNKGKEIQNILKKGIFLEKTALGGNVFATGVFSYGDLSANFNGMRFWNHMLLKENDILGAQYNVGPYIKCEDNKFTVNAVIDFRTYVDASMDESVNCSKFATKDGEEKFKASLAALHFTDKDGNAACPVESDKMAGLKEKYKAHNIQHFILNDDGTGTVSYFNEF